MIGRITLVSWLRQLRAQVNNDKLPVIRVAIGEMKFAWHTLQQCTDCGYRGIDVGQDGDCRYRTDGREGLHAQVFVDEGVIDFHLDEVDVCRDPAGHAVEDTRIVAGTLAGTAIGTLIGALIAGKEGAVIGALLGGGGGATIGVATPKRTRQVFHFHELCTFAV